MKTKWLFPHAYRLIGWLIFVPSLLLGIISLNIDPLTETVFSPFIHLNPALFNWLKWEYIDEFEAIGIIIGLLFIAFSREKVEDEMIGQMRLEALQWSVYVNYLILIIAIVAVYELDFLNVMIYNMFTVLLVFIARFRWLIFQTTVLRYEKSTES